MKNEGLAIINELIKGEIRSLKEAKSGAFRNRWLDSVKGKTLKTKSGEKYQLSGDTVNGKFHYIIHYNGMKMRVGEVDFNRNGPDKLIMVMHRDMSMTEAMSPTERSRRFRKRHPGRVAKYLKDTVKDRSARNRDRAKAVKKHGKSKMANHDVHHPEGPNGGSWRLAKKDHGPDKKK